MKDVWNYVLAILIALIIVGVYQIISQPCTLTFEVHKGINFDQPYPTYRHCEPGELPIVR